MMIYYIYYNLHYITIKFKIINLKNHFKYFNFLNFHKNLIIFSPMTINTKNSCESYYSGMVNCTAACASLVKQSCCCVGFPASLYVLS